MRNSISIYRLFKIINIIFVILMIFTYLSIGDNSYINKWSIFLGVIMCIISHFVLSDAERNKNHLLCILAYIMVLHYELRVITLNYTEYSYIFGTRFPVNTNQINATFFYCILAYLVCWFSFRYSTRHIHVKSGSNETLKNKAARNVLLVMYGSFILQEMSVMGIPFVVQIVGIASTFFLNAVFILLFGISFFIYNWNIVTRKQKLFFLLYLAMHILLHTIGGSRSAIYTIVIMMFICLLAFNLVKVKIRYLVLGVLVLPFMAFLFLYATLTRSLGEKAASVSDAKEITSVLSAQSDGKDISIVLAPVFDRIAFFDFTVEMVQNREYLRQYIRPIYYVESVVDNLLTPGFNVFDMPRASYIVDKCYYIKGKPSIEKYNLNDTSYYHSDCLTWFGEAYLLFGMVLVLPVILLVGIIIRNKYYDELHKSGITSTWKRIVILYVTYTLLYSYGLDWLFIDIVGLIINYYIFKAVTISKQKQILVTNNV
ncbi:MAG: hypothetical protein BWY74_00176 [Firmicutes bacterium ADurb.Bin419]|nr:MAG: hypothetical protein BWY74_00176 [Firmicutes bacterium ADurb.Bin419]